MRSSLISLVSCDLGLFSWAWKPAAHGGYKSRQRECPRVYDGDSKQNVFNSKLTHVESLPSPECQTKRGIRGCVVQTLPMTEEETEAWGGERDNRHKRHFSGVHFVPNNPCGISSTNGERKCPAQGYTYVFNINKEEDKVLISLQQRDQRPHRKHGRGDNYTIGFEIFRVELNREYRLHQLQVQERVVGSTYVDSRTVFLRTILKKGRYVIIPTLFQPGDVSEFILRLFTDIPSELRELTLDKPEPRCRSFLCGYPQRVTQLTVHSVEGLDRQNSSGRANPYLIIKCGKEIVRSPVQKETFDAVFDTQAIFYRKNLKEPIVVQVWNKKLLCDRFLGQVTLVGEPGDSRELRTLQLRDKGAPDAPPVTGHLSLKVVSTDDLVEL